MSLGGLFRNKVGRVAKVKSDRDLVDSGIKASVDALGYSGAARFLRHFSKGKGDYSSFNRSFSKEWTWQRSTRRQKSIIEPSNSVASLPVVFHSTIVVVFHVFGIPETWKCHAGRVVDA